MKNYQKIIKTIGKTYFKLAVQWGRETQEPETRAMALRYMETKKGKKCETRAAKNLVADTLLDTAVKIWWKRFERKNHSPATPPLLAGLERLQYAARKRRERVVKEWLYRNASDYSGSTHYTVSTRDIVGAYTTTSRGEQYSRGCTYRKTNANHTIEIKPDYWHKVIRRGIMELNGMLTLDAEWIDHPTRTVYRAAWVRVKGKRIVKETGFIAISESGSAHSSTIAGACGILTTRENAVRYARAEAKIRAQLEAMELEGYGKIMVTFEDSLAAGNCRPGTEHFRDKHFPGRDSASVREILAAGEQRKLAINACIHAIRKARRTLTAA